MKVLNNIQNSLIDAEEDGNKQKSLYFFLFLLLLVFSFFHRLDFWFTQRLWPDEALYAWIAQQIYHNPSFAFSEQATSFHPPLFSIFSSLGYYFFSDEFGPRMIACLFNISGIILIYYIGIKISSRFVGLLAAIFLSFNYTYALQSNMILIDGPLTVIYMLLISQLLNRKLANSYGQDFMTGLVTAGALLLKWSGILAIPMIIIYYLCGLTNLHWTMRLKKLSIPLGMTGILIGVLSIAGMTPVTKALEGQYFIKPFWYYFIHLAPMTGTPAFLLPFFIIGLIFMYTRGRQRAILTLAWFFVPLIGASFAAEKIPRYILPIVPCMALVSALGIEKTTKMFIKQRLRPISLIIVTIFFILMFYQFQKVYAPGIQQINFSYTGFKQAGQWIKDHAKDDTLIFADSKRAIRYFSGFNFKEYDGNISAFPVNEEEFARMLSILPKKDIILVLDIWEYTQPSWVYPSTLKKLRHLIDLGFETKLVVKRTSQQGSPRPVVWILQNNKK